MSITATELKENLGYYLSLAKEETIFITRNGRDVAVLTSPEKTKMDSLNSLIGIIPDTGMSVEDYREERLSKYL